MWRRIFQIFGSAVPKVPPSNGITSSQANLDSISQARAQLNASIKELSKGTKYQSLADTQAISKLIIEDSSNLTKISTEELDIVANSYFEGSNGIEKDCDQAIRCWQESSRRGSLLAKYSLATCLRDGIGTDKNLPEALGILQDLANSHNLSLAHYATALMLYNGEGTEDSASDYEKAFFHFRAAARGGIPPALNNIANMYAAGQGVEQSDKRAFRYYEAAAMETGDPLAKFSLANFLAKGRGTPVDATRAFTLYLECAQLSQGHPIAVFNVGAAYLGGIGTDVDYNEALKYFQKAADMGIVEANVNLGNMYRQGFGVQKDLCKAIEVFASGADKNDICKALLEETLAELNNTSTTTTNTDVGNVNGNGFAGVVKEI
eukprot:gene11511-24074_t